MPFSRAAREQAGREQAKTIARAKQQAAQQAERDRHSAAVKRDQARRGK
jgi:type II secretory pathway component HofQ